VTQPKDTVVGRIPVLECLRAGKRRAHCLYVSSSAKGLEDITKAAAAIPIEQVGRTDLDRLADGVMHQGVVLHANPLPVLSLEEWLAREIDPNAFVLVLDGVEDPQNFGAMARSAAALGAAGIIFGKDRSAPISSATAKAAAGALEYIDLVRVTNLSRALEKLKQEGFWSAALAADAQQSIWQADLTGKFAVVIGNEGKGVRPLVAKKCDIHLSIPISGPISSLNASVSAALILGELRRQRPPSKNT
jgi:23S rRNA (guanosine2251-2'-O)-methyltransferase